MTSRRPRPVRTSAASPSITLDRPRAGPGRERLVVQRVAQAGSWSPRRPGPTASSETRSPGGTRGCPSDAGPSAVPMRRMVDGAVHDRRRRRRRASDGPAAARWPAHARPGCHPGRPRAGWTWHPGRGRPGGTARCRSRPCHGRARIDLGPGRDQRREGIRIERVEVAHDEVDVQAREQGAPRAAVRADDQGPGSPRRLAARQASERPSATMTARSGCIGTATTSGCDGTEVACLDSLRRYEPDQVPRVCGHAALSAPGGAPLSLCCCVRMVAHDDTSRSEGAEPGPAMGPGPGGPRARQKVPRGTLSALRSCLGLEVPAVDVQDRPGARIQADRLDDTKVAPWNPG